MWRSEDLNRKGLPEWATRLSQRGQIIATPFALLYCATRSEFWHYAMPRALGPTLIVDYESLQLKPVETMGTIARFFDLPPAFEYQSKFTQQEKRCIPLSDTIYNSKWLKTFLASVIRTLSAVVERSGTRLPAWGRQEAPGVSGMSNLKLRRGSAPHLGFAGDPSPVEVDTLSADETDEDVAGPLSDDSLTNSKPARLLRTLYETAENIAETSLSSPHAFTFEELMLRLPPPLKEVVVEGEPIHNGLAWFWWLGEKVNPTNPQKTMGRVGGLIDPVEKDSMAFMSRRLIDLKVTDFNLRLTLTEWLATAKGLLQELETYIKDC